MLYTEARLESGHFVEGSQCEFFAVSSLLESGYDIDMNPIGGVCREKSCLTLPATGDGYFSHVLMVVSVRFVLLQ